MGLRDDDEQIFEDRVLLDWAREAPEPPGDYDRAPTEEEQAAYEYERRKHAERKPRIRNRYPDR